jgi:hypothetical protein
MKPKKSESTAFPLRDMRLMGSHIMNDDPFRLFQNKLLDDVVRYAICIFALGIVAWEYPIGFLLIALCAVIT